MNTTSHYTHVLVAVCFVEFAVAESALVFVGRSDVADRQWVEVSNATSVSTREEPMASTTHGDIMWFKDRARAGALQWRSPEVGRGSDNVSVRNVVGTSLKFADSMLVDNTTAVEQIMFHDLDAASRSATPVRVVPEPQTWVIILLGVFAILASRHTAPINLRTVHSRLRARRDHAPTR